MLYVLIKTEKCLNCLKNSMSKPWRVKALWLVPVPHDLFLQYSSLQPHMSLFAVYLTIYFNTEHHGIVDFCFPKYKARSLTIYFDIGK